MLRWHAVGVALAATLLASDADAQPFAPSDHWTRAALRRLVLDGALEAALATAAWPLPETTIARAFAAAASDSATPHAPSDRYAGWLREERRGSPASRGVEVVVRTALGARLRDGGVRAGAATPTAAGFDDPGPVAVPDFARPFGHAQLDVSTDQGALRVSGEVEGDEVSLADSFLTVAPGAVHLWLGRRGLSIGPTVGGGIVLGDATAFDGGGIETPDGFRLPAFLGSLGDIRVAQLVARMDRSGDLRHPWFVASRVSFAPSSRLAVGFNRAALFGGEGNEPVTAERVLLMLVGLTDVGGKDSDFENQVASADVYWRVPASFPLAVYLEYGVDDSGLAFLNVPAVIAGIEVAASAQSPWSAVIEHIRFEPRARTTYPKWYRHGALGEGWTDRGEPLGWPLGGHGRETTLAFRLDASEIDMIGNLRLSARHRGGENLFAPDREGTALGAALDVVWFAARRVRIAASAAGERGRTWDTAALEIAAQYVF